MIFTLVVTGWGWLHLLAGLLIFGLGGLAIGVEIERFRGRPRRLVKELQVPGWDDGTWNQDC